MGLPHAPFLELNFYFADLSETQAFASLSHALSNLGANLTGEGRVHKGSEINNSSFSHTHDYLLETVIFDPIEIDQMLVHPDLRLIQVYVQKALGRKNKSAVDILTYQSISEAASLVDKHPIAIWLDGTAFDPISGLEAEAKRVGKRAYQQFLALIKQTSPSYAAITMEYALECPTDLKIDPRTLALSDFFISNRFIEKDQIAEIQVLYRNAYVEIIPEGIYVSCYRFFNPKGISLPLETRESNAKKVAKLIGLYAPS